MKLIQIKKLRVYSVAIILVLGICILSTPILSLASVQKGKRGENEEKKSVKKEYIWFYGDDDSIEEEWTLVHDGRGVKAYPDLREYVWEKFPEEPPNDDNNRIGLRRVVKAGIKPQGVIFICPGTWSNAEQMTSNPPEDPWTKYENYTLPLYLANRDFDVYAIDYRTHFLSIYNESDELSFMAEWGWDQWISDIKEAVDLAKEVSGAKRIFIAGESFGGSAAMNFASLYWEEDLKGIILLDGGTGAKYPENVDNEYDLPSAIAAMVAMGLWSNEIGPLEQFLIYQYANMFPWAPAVNPVTYEPLEPIENPLTPEYDPWANITEWAAFMIYIAWGLGGVSNIYGGFGKPSVMIHILTTFDRHWPSRLGLESAAIRDWDDCPFVSYDFDDHYCEIDVPLIAFRSDPDYSGVEFRHGIANPDFTGKWLPGFGHLDVYSGEYSEEMVKAPTYEWMVSRRMLVGWGMIWSDGHCIFGFITIYINATTIDLKINGIRVAWNVVCHKTYKKKEIYKGENDLGTIKIFIKKGFSIAYGCKIFFFGCSV